uniref:DUF445 domain-containing protein n=1 Tax=Thaumasiovibrio occultus TaxID=1891184 RepID=UPI000B359803|nr:DUF445 domain-containing protein [Thaumasiovibrio occultus]
MNKSLLTNIIALAVFGLGLAIDNTWVLYAGLFALSGAITNWLAIHMLFEKVPGLYGSGVIPARFEAFKAAIKHLMMVEFFNQQNIDRFLQSELDSGKEFDLAPVLEHVDLSPSFDGLVEVINHSPFGGMLAMFGGQEALEPLRQPFIEKMKSEIQNLTHQSDVKQALMAQFDRPEMMDEIQTKIEAIIEQRLEELTPQMVKEMVQTMIREHLGWLVVWGGVFGGVIGVLSAYFI